MKHITQNKFLWPALFVAGFFAALVLHDTFAQNDGSPGSNTPPGPPSTGVGNTLEDIFNSVSGSPGKNFGALFEATAYAYDAASDTWFPQAITGASSGVMVESNGNIAVYGTIGVAAWSPSTGWVTFGAVLNTPEQLVGSNGNFCVRNATTTSVWNKSTGAWVTLTNAELPGPTEIVASNGNFCAFGTNRVAAWNEDTGAWKIQAGSGAFVTIVGAD